MKSQIVQRTLLSAVAAAMALAGTGVPARADDAQQQTDQAKDRKKQQQEAARTRQEQKQAQKDEKQQQRQRQVQQKQERQEEQRRANRAQRDQAVRAQRQERETQAQQRSHDRAASTNPRRRPEAGQRQLIEQQRLRLERYNQGLVQEERAAEQHASLLQTQQRAAQYRYQQRYLDRLRQQQRETANWQSYDYDRDPYFYTAPTHRYSYGGRWYDTNQYGVEYLRQAVNNGYEEGFHAGQADREDRWRGGSYRESYGYQDANFGYNGRYIDQGQYNHYFREGFQRGFDDGFNRRDRYGRSSGGRYSVMALVLSRIVNVRSIQ
jgi:hypothetical protein